LDYKSKADQSPQGLIAGVEKTTSIPVESTGAIIDPIAKAVAIATPCEWSERVRFPPRTAW